MVLSQTAQYAMRGMSVLSALGPGATARTRDLAIARMRRALDAMVIEGIKTTIPLHLKIMDNPDFQAGNFSTRFMEEFLAKNKVREQTA